MMVLILVLMVKVVMLMLLPLGADGWDGMVSCHSGGISRVGGAANMGGRLTRSSRFIK